MLEVHRNHWLRLGFIEITCLRLEVERNYLLGVHRNHQFRLGLRNYLLGVSWGSEITCLGFIEITS